MSTELNVVLHRIPSFIPGPGTDEDRERATYRAIIDRTSPHWLMVALVDDHDFDVSLFGVDDVDFHDACSEAIAASEVNPQAISAAREHLYEVVDEQVIGNSPHRADVPIGDMWVAIYAGQSCGNEPFEGYGGVCALSVLPELSPTPADGVQAGLHGDVCGSIGDGMDPAVMQWAAANPWLVDGVVAAEIDERESVISDVVDSVMSEIRADIRDAVVRRIESMLETVDA